MIDAEKLKASLRLHEGKRLAPYKDSLGVLTIGVGHNLSRGISDACAEFMLNEDLLEATELVRLNIPWALVLDDVRARVFVELAFNLGHRLLAFHDTLAAAKARDFGRAADLLGRTLWAHQVDDGVGGRVGRADVLCAMLRTGKDPNAWNP